MTAREFDLGKSELEVLKVLWEDGPGTVRQVLERLHARGRRVAYTTVQTFLTRLQAKGYVTSDKSGFAHEFRPRVSRERVTRSRLNALVQQLFDGAVGPLVLQLVADERLSPEEIAQLQRLIERLDAERQANRDAPQGPA